MIMVAILEWYQRQGCGPCHTGSNPVGHPIYREVAFGQTERTQVREQMQVSTIHGYTGGARPSFSAT